MARPQAACELRTDPARGPGIAPAIAEGHAVQRNDIRRLGRGRDERLHPVIARMHVQELVGIKRHGPVEVINAGGPAQLPVARVLGCLALGHLVVDMDDGAPGMQRVQQPLGPVAACVRGDGDPVKAHDQVMRHEFEDEGPFVLHAGQKCDRGRCHGHASLFTCAPA